jgi:uncharacterized protein YqhQ
MGEKYAVTFTFDKKKGEHVYGIYPIGKADQTAAEKVKDVPFIRGFYSLGRSEGMRISLGASLIGMFGSALLASAEKNGKVRKGRVFLGSLLGTAPLAFTAWMIWRVFGFDGAVRKYHGAEHKVINAYLKNERAITEEEAELASRISRRCGTNFVVYYGAASLAVGILPVGGPLLKQLLAVGLAYEGFRMPEEKMPALKRTLGACGDALQRYITTAEPDKAELAAAKKGLDLLVKAEAGELTGEELEMYKKNAENRPFFDRMFG